MSRITLLIKKERLLMYPEGTHLQGVLFEKQMKHQNPEKVWDRFGTRLKHIMN